MTNTLEDLWIGIDVGTQSVRAMLVQSDGTIVGSGSSKLTSNREGVRHEQDPIQTWRATAEACRAAMRGLRAERVRGVAVDATSGSILLVDRDGKPRTQVVMYDDGRAANLGKSKVLWLMETESRDGDRVIHQSDFINQNLVGSDVATDWSNALKSGYDLVNQRWSSEILQSILPPVVRPGTQIGVVCAAASTETAIPQGTPVIAGMTDGCASQIAAGAVNVGQWNSVLGTTLVIKGVTKDLIVDPNGIVYSHRSADGCWLPGGASNVGAGIISKEFS